MQMTRIGSMTFVTLSRRNLQTLLNKLDQPESARTLYRDTESGERLVVVGEEDELHYQGRQPGRVKGEEAA